MCLSREPVAKVMEVAVEEAFPAKAPTLRQVFSENNSCVSPTSLSPPFSRCLECQRRSPGELGRCLCGAAPGLVGGGQWAAPERMPRALNLLLAGLAVGLGFGALAEVAKKSLRPEDPSGELGP